MSQNEWKIVLYRLQNIWGRLNLMLIGLLWV